MTPSPFHIRPAEPRDAETIADFNAAMAMETERLALDRPTLLAGVRAALADERKARYFVAAAPVVGAGAAAGSFPSGGTGAADRVVGQLMLTRGWSDWRNGEIWWIQSVYVAHTFRGRGVFRALYRHVHRLAREQGAVGLRLYVEKDNAAAQKTYASLGMTVTHYLVMEEMFRNGGS
jgi:ribosomal protein S18 acetylase RimI-like enzyme